MTDQRTKDKLNELQCRLVAHRMISAYMLSAISTLAQDPQQFLDSMRSHLTETVEQLPVSLQWREHFTDEVLATIRQAETWTGKD
ncbi:hypothetical protein UA18_01695 [Burkholderia multivorans]|uniref:Uncharacterized protein n=1 Tax=Burkholderia multivorans TaxID=87883 RepID=A0ABD7LHN9_9BURK|nr:hypothetical protein [Burkholderia multivorans]SAK17008.1 hypothetical protein UA18_01695 [Burkholderia multivorans]SAK19779.1 hypothetical protein UA17_01896 [Burkholderia multivorans]HEF5152736.1 hypothetical protein [Burkholderia multivorans]